MEEKSMEKLKAELKRLEDALADRKAALPAHSIRPWQLEEVEELEDKVKKIRSELDERLKE